MPTAAVADILATTPLTTIFTAVADILATAPPITVGLQL